ncbi:hypothetical protein WJX84_009248 [Apatococcus fuscideae]
MTLQPFTHARSLASIQALQQGSTCQPSLRLGRRSQHQGVRLQMHSAQQKQRQAERDKRRLLRTVQGLQKELTLARVREDGLQDLANDLHLVFMNELDISPASRRAMFQAVKAYAANVDIPGTDRSVARAGRLAWQAGWCSAEGQSLMQGIWHAVICCNASAELVFDATLPGIEAICQRSQDLHQLIQDPPHVFMERCKAYSRQINVLLDEANGDPSSAAAGRACELACENFAQAIAKAGRFPLKYNASQSTMVLPSDARATPKQKHYARVAAAMGLTDRQKRMALARRELYWVELGRILWHRERLVKQLQSAAVQLENEAEGEVDSWLALPSPISSEVAGILNELRQSMNYQRYLARNFNWHVMLEVLTPYQFTILLGRCYPYAIDAMAAIDAIASDKGSATMQELLGRHLSLPFPSSNQVKQCGSVLLNASTRSQ